MFLSWSDHCTGFANEQKRHLSNERWRFMAPPARLERTTFRLGGGPSILVRYGGKFQQCYLTKTNSSCQSFGKDFKDCAYNDL